MNVHDVNITGGVYIVNLTRASYHHGDLRNALTDAAIELVREHGLAGWSLREAARTVGVTPTAVYRHFADKQALLGAVAYAQFRRMSQALQQARDEAGDDAQAAMRGMAVAYLRFARADPEIFRVLFGPDAASLSLDGQDPRALDTFQEGVDALIASGAVPAAARALAEATLWSTVHGFSSLVVDEVVGLDPVGSEQTMAAMVDVVVRGLRDAG